MDTVPVSNKTAGEPESAYNSALETGAGMTQVTIPDYANIEIVNPLCRTSLQSSEYAPISTPSTHTPTTQSATP